MIRHKKQQRKFAWKLKDGLTKDNVIVRVAFKKAQITEQVPLMYNNTTDSL